MGNESGLKFGGAKFGVWVGFKRDGVSIFFYQFFIPLSPLDLRVLCLSGWL